MPNQCKPCLVVVNNINIHVSKKMYWILEYIIIRQTLSFRIIIYMELFMITLWRNSIHGTDLILLRLEHNHPWRHIYVLKNWISPLWNFRDSRVNIWATCIKQHIFHEKYFLDFLWFIFGCTMSYFVHFCK